VAIDKDRHARIIIVRRETKRRRIYYCFVSSGFSEITFPIGEHFLRVGEFQLPYTHPQV
jgi:hypothetical protein